MRSSKSTVRPITAENWEELASLFESRGGPKYCWCMAWRRLPPGARKLRSKARQAALKEALFECVESGTPVGIVIRMDGAAVGWCSVAPRESYRRLGGVLEDGEDPAGVWSIACFFVKREFRGVGLPRELLAGAIRYAAENGARVVEAYPVMPDSPSYRFMGIVQTFEKAGFSAVGMAGARRHVMRLAL